MKRKSPPKARLTLPILALLPLLGLSSCLNTRPKTFPYPKIDFSDNDTGIQSQFLFNFAYRDPSSATVPITTYLQGQASSSSALVGACNLAGTACICEFQDSNGAVITSTNSTQIEYDSTGNYYRCTQSSGAAAAKVRIHNLDDTITSAVLDVNTSLTLQQIVGNDLSTNYVRSVFSYSCLMTFLQKFGTTTTNFDCTDPGAANACNGDNFCLLQSRLPFYLYADNYLNNFSAKVADKLYNDASTGIVCGIQIQQFQCADQQGTPVKAFGLYSSQTGIWNTSVLLGPGPNLALETYGFAAQVSPDTNECPPGLVKRVFYRVSPISNASASNSNYPGDLVASQVADPASTPAGIYINQIPGGHCNGIACTLPASGVLTVSTQSYSSSGETTFCVIPGTLLP